MNKDLLEYIEKNSKKKNKNLKYDFMPSLLEIIEKPSHVAGRVIIWAIFLILTFTITWAYVSKVDVVVSARGKIEPIKEPEIISAKGSYKIVAINVEEGECVKQGDLVLELSAEEQEEEMEDLEVQIKSLESFIQLYQRIQEGEDISNVELSKYDKSDRGDIESIIDNFILNKEMVQQYTSSNFVEQAEKLNKEYKKEIQKALTEKEEKQEEVNKRIEKLKEEISAAKVYAPSDGVIYKLYVEKENIVVSANQMLVSYVSSDEKLQLKCYISNSDVTDLKVNQKVNIKLDAYPYSRYGTIDGMITFIGQKVLDTEGKSDMVLVKVDILNEEIGKKLLIGLTGSADIITSKRRIINYFLDPITGALQESVREK